MVLPPFFVTTKKGFKGAKEMISRTNYILDFKKKLAREMSLGENSAARISKRESISVQTLYRWRDRYGFNGEVKVDSEKEIKELKNLLAK
jgi:transposase-like protein